MQIFTVQLKVWYRSEISIVRYEEQMHAKGKV